MCDVWSHTYLVPEIASVESVRSQPHRVGSVRAREINHMCFFNMVEGRVLCFNRWVIHRGAFIKTRVWISKRSMKLLMTLFYRRISTDAFYLVSVSVSVGGGEFNINADLSDNNYSLFQ